MKGNIFLINFLLISIQTSLSAHDHTFESWKNDQLRNYPFECVPTGATQEYTRCSAEDLLKQDWSLRKELNDDELWNDWRKARGKICYHFQDKRFGQGTVKPLMILSCQMRLNSEVERYCITGEDKKCG